MATLQVEKQAVSAQKDDLSWLFDAERGAVALNHDRTAAYVKGSETIYFVPIPAMTCECRGYEVRGHCFHVDRVRETLREIDPCPVCRGAGVIQPDPSVVYITNGKRDTAPIPRLCCMGEGTRSAWIEGGRVGVVRVAGMSEDERRRLFR